jgi:hypothetical protein
MQDFTQQIHSSLWLSRPAVAGIISDPQRPPLSERSSLSYTARDGKLVTGPAQAPGWCSGRSGQEP